VAHARKIHSIFLGRATQLDESTWSYDGQIGESGGFVAWHFVHVEQIAL
jgi:hypothetical protein